jgi:LuxR family transcriptional regulator, maltose regulon positive regulatory protein
LPLVSRPVSVGPTAVSRPAPALAAPEAPAVARDRLVRRLLAARGARLVVLSAPAGYGKTTLLRAWAAADSRPFHWARGDRDFGGPRRAADEPAGVRVEALATPFVLVVEDADAIRGVRARSRLQRMAAAIPPGSSLVLAARGEPGLALGRVRAESEVVELGPRDLAMTHREAAELLRGAGIMLGARGLDTLMRRTDGWPVALSLAAVALRDEADPDAAAARFRGTDRAVGDYVRDELLARRSAEELELLLQTSVLHELDADVCDAVLGRAGSGVLLRDLGRSDLPLIALDRAEEHFRCHPLLRDALAAELRRRDPASAALAHRRASAWFEERDDTTAAIEHAVAGGAFDRAAALLARATPAYAWGGRAAALERWLERLPARERERRPAIALSAATCRLVRGDAEGAVHWAAVAGAPLEPAAGLLAAAAGAAGVKGMRTAAARAGTTLDSASPWRALSGLLGGAAAALAGDPTGARALLEDGVRHGAIAAPALAALCQAQLALLALEAEDWDEGAALAERARLRADAAGEDGDPMLALVHAASAFARAQRGRLEEARMDAAAAVELMRVEPPPWCEAAARLAVARASLRLGDVAAARTHIERAARVAARVPGAVALAADVERAAARADEIAREALRAPGALTTAELRVLRLLPSHLSFREIGARLHISANTVKTQAHSVYRKLDASSRSAAVDRASAMGLLSG